MQAESKETEANAFGIEVKDLTPADLRGKIHQLEQAMFQMPARQITIEPKHHFAKGMYAREILIPKDTTLTGKTHKTQHINVISQGEISVLTDEGMKRIKAPYTFIAPPGTKRVGYAHEDTVWTTFHATDETDLDKLELELIDNSPAQLEEKPCLGLP